MTLFDFSPLKRSPKMLRTTGVPLGEATKGHCHRIKISTGRCNKAPTPGIRCQFTNRLSNYKMGPGMTCDLSRVTNVEGPNVYLEDFVLSRRSSGDCHSASHS